MKIWSKCFNIILIKNVYHANSIALILLYNVKGDNIYVLKHNEDFLLYTGDHIIDNTLLSDPLNSMIAINRYALTKLSHASKHYPVNPLYPPSLLHFPISYAMKLVN